MSNIECNNLLIFETSVDAMDMIYNDLGKREIKNKRKQTFSGSSYTSKRKLYTGTHLETLSVSWNTVKHNGFDAPPVFGMINCRPSL
jgi:hypothetical protein